MKATCTEVISKTTDEVRNLAFNMAPALNGTEVLTGTPVMTIVSATTTGLTLSNPAVNLVATTVNGTTVSAGQAVLFTVTAGTQGVSYLVKGSCGTDEGQTLVEIGTLQVM